MKRIFITIFSLTFFFITSGQISANYADSIRIKYKIPELAFAVISADTIFELQVLGIQRINTDFKANPDDRFHIGSNTKAITSLIAALLVEQGQIKWNTKFFGLFPQLKQKSKKKYQNITLQDLLTFRGKLPAYTYTFDNPTKDQIKGDDNEQRLQLAEYFISQKPMKKNSEGLTPSNVDYIIAGLMLEKASGKPYKQLVTSFGNTEGISFNFDYPNLSDTLQPWGHDRNLNPLPPFDNYKLNWLLSAGNINISLPDYIKFIQLQLKGLKGETKILSSQTFEKLLYGLPVFSYGWFNKIDDKTSYHIAYNEGDAGAFISWVEIIKEMDKAYIVLTNSATKETKEGISVLVNLLKTRDYR